MKPSVDLWAGNRLQASDSKLLRKIRPNWAAGEPQTSQAAKMSKVTLHISQWCWWLWAWRWWLFCGNLCVNIYYMLNLSNWYSLNIVHSMPSSSGSRKSEWGRRQGEVSGSDDGDDARIILLTVSHNSHVLIRRRGRNHTGEVETIQQHPLKGIPLEEMHMLLGMVVVESYYALTPVFDH